MMAVYPSDCLPHNSHQNWAGQPSLVLPKVGEVTHRYLMGRMLWWLVVLRLKLVLDGDFVTMAELAQDYR